MVLKGFYLNRSALRQASIPRAERQLDHETFAAAAQVLCACSVNIIRIEFWSKIGYQQGLPKFCTQCGTPLRGPFCTECGFRFTSAAPVPSMPASTSASPLRLSLPAVLPQVSWLRKTIFLSFAETVILQGQGITEAEKIRLRILAKKQQAASSEQSAEPSPSQVSGSCRPQTQPESPGNSWIKFL